MKIGKTIELDCIPMKILKCLGEEGLNCQQSYLILFLGLHKCLTNGDLVQLSHYIKMRVIN